MVKRRNAIRTVGATATLGVLGGTAAAKPPCDGGCRGDCICKDWCYELCGGCFCY